MTKQEILDTLRQWRDETRRDFEVADRAALFAIDDHDPDTRFELQSEARREWHRWSRICDAVSALDDYEER